MPVPGLLRPWGTVVAAVALAAAVAPPAAAAPSRPDAGRAAAAWLATQLDGGHLTNFGVPDWGLTADAYFALAATGADPAATARVRAELAAHVRSYTTYDDWGFPGVRIAGATAKLLAVAASGDADPADFGGVDLRAETLELVDGTGRVRDRIPAELGGDQSNTFAQSFAVLGLARSGGVPQPVVDFLVDQQCAAGGFRLMPDASPTCDGQAGATLDTDSTAMAVQALLAAADAGADGARAAAEKGAAWLADRQDAGGGFGGSGPTSGLNTNSAGLAGQALAAAGYDEAADRAAAWVAGLQRTAAPDAGAIAYDPAGFAAGTIDDVSRDQWRRATAQALLALAGVPFGEIGATPPPTAGPTTPPSPTASPTASAAPTTGVAAPGGGGGLPITGAPAAVLAGVAAALVGGGAVLVVAGRRRRAP